MIVPLPQIHTIGLLLNACAKKVRAPQILSVNFQHTLYTLYFVAVGNIELYLFVSAQASEDHLRVPRRKS